MNSLSNISVPFNGIIKNIRIDKRKIYPCNSLHNFIRTGGIAPPQTSRRGKRSRVWSMRGASQKEIRLLINTAPFFVIWKRILNPLSSGFELV